MMSIFSLPTAKIRPQWLGDEDYSPHRNQIAALAVALQASLARESASQQALLSLQSRTTSPEAAEQLAIAARRVAAFGSVHRRLHLLDDQKTVEFRQYLDLLCKDLSALLFQYDDDGHSLTVEGPTIEIETVTAIPLGFIVSELITNAAKYAPGDVTVQIGGTPAAGYSLSVLDDGPGMPAEFDPMRCKGLGTKIVLALVKQIGGELKVMPGNNGRGT
jgi:two-component system, sensor histidine kinase PdtaS